MPYRTNTTRRRIYRAKPRPFIRKRRGRYRKPTATVPRSLKQKVFNFKRDVEQTLTLSNIAPPEGWSSVDNRIYNTLAYSLGSLGANTDFTALFRNYRLKGARVRMFFSNTMSGTEQDSQHANTQVLVRMAPNHRGQADTMNTEYWTSVQAKKYKLGLNGGKPLDIYMPLKQRNEVASSTGTTTTMISPKFISTDNTNVIHYGLNLSFERADGQDFTSGFNNNQRVKLITTLYFQCMGVE